MKKVLLEMEDQKNSYEQKAKESLQKVLEEKMSAEQQLQSTQVQGCCVILGAGTLGWLWAAWDNRTTPWNPQGTLLLSEHPLSGPWLWPSRSVKSGGASTKL